MADISSSTELPYVGQRTVIDLTDEPRISLSNTSISSERIADLVSFFCDDEPSSFVTFIVHMSYITVLLEQYTY